MAIVDYSQGYPFMLGGNVPQQEDDLSPWDAEIFRPKGIAKSDSPSILTALLGRKPDEPAEIVPGGRQGLANDVSFQNYGGSREFGGGPMEQGLQRLGQAKLGPPPPMPVPDAAAPAAAPQVEAPPQIPQFAQNAMQAPYSLLASALPGAGAAPAPAQAAPAPAAPSTSTMPTDITSRSASPPAAAEEPGFFDKINNFTKQNPMLLMSLAAGFAGAPSFGTGMSRAFTNAVAGGQADQRQNSALQAQAATFRALVASGMPKQQALAASQNPEIMKIVAPDYLGTRKAEIKTIEEQDAFGNKRQRIVAIDPYTNQAREVTTPGAAGAPGGADAGGTGVPGLTGQGATKMFAPGVSMDNFDHTKSGDEYLSQFSPEVQASAKDYIAGKSLPTSKGADQVVKKIAQKYGADMGIDVSDQAYHQRKEWATSLANTKSGVGFQAKGFQQGLQHMKDLSDNLVKLGNSGGMGIEPLARGANTIRGLSSEVTGKQNKVSTDAQLLAGEAMKLFSGSTGGGVHEREEMRNRFGDPKMSPTAAAGALEAALDAMHGGLTPLEARRDALFPKGNAPAGSEFIGKAENEAIKAIRANIEKLRNGQTGSSDASTPADITKGLMSGTLKPEQYPQQWALIQEAKRRNLLRNP